jgi:4-hydroxybenzoate polyprenyltransferase
MTLARSGHPPAVRQGLGLLRACHPGPTAAVTLLATAYAASLAVPPGRMALVAAAVLTGQLSIGWCNDLVDLGRDRAVGREDKPLATGDVEPRVVRVACATALVATVVLSLATGLLAGLVHLVCVAAGWAYDLGLKATAASWLPYAVAFGLLPGFVSLAAPAGDWPAPWVLAAGALLGTGAHLLNALPDLDDDEATGVRGLPHRLGPRRAAVGAVGCLAAATLLLVLAVPAGTATRTAVVLLAVVLSVAALTTRGRWPFRMAIGIAALDVVLRVVSA